MRYYILTYISRISDSPKDILVKCNDGVKSIEDYAKRRIPDSLQIRSITTVDVEKAVDSCVYEEG